MSTFGIEVGRLGGHVKPILGDILYLFHRRRRDENSEVVPAAVHEPDRFIRTVQKRDLVVLHLQKVLQDALVDRVYLETAQAPVVSGSKSISFFCVSM